MATCLNYNCEALGDHEVATLTCKGPRPSGISEVVFILCGNSLTDPSDGAEVAALIAADDAKLVQQIRMGVGTPEATLSPKTTACGLPQTLYVTYSGNIIDYSWNTTNFAFWDTLANGYTVAGAIARLCPKTGFDDESVYLNGEMSFSGGAIIADTDEEPARFELTFTYKGSIELIPTPTGVFSA